MRTTLELPDPIFKEVKTRAVQQGVKLKDLLAQYIVAGMNAPRSATPPPITPVPLPYFRQPNGTVVPARSNAELEAILENDDIAAHRQASATSQLEA